MMEAEAEWRGALAVAGEQEMVAIDPKYIAEVVFAEASIPVAMTGAFRAGRTRCNESRESHAPGA